MNFFNILLVVVIVILSFSVFGLLFVNFTGHDLRAYSVLPPDAVIEIGGKPKLISELASEYQPTVNIKKTNPSPPLLWTWYEAIKTETAIDLVYYQVWEDEINPDPFIHWFYRLFRSAYYGSPVRDIEYFQISISPSNGEVQNIMFETSPGDDYFVTFSEHVVVSYQRTSNGSYNVIRRNRSGVELSRASGIQLIFDQDHMLVLAQTWNHLTRFVASSDTDLNQLPTPLKFLTDEEYSAYKFVRKSQGDHRTEENPWTMRIGMLAYIILLPGIVYLAFRSKKRRQNER